MAGPADHGRYAEGAFPVGVLFAAERGGCRIRPRELIRPVVRRVDHDGVLGDAQVIQLFQEFAHVLVMLPHAVGIIVAGHAALALVLGPDVREQVHARGVHPQEERLVVLAVLVQVVQRRAHRFVVDGLHALGGQGAGVLDLAVGRRLDHATRHIGLDDGVLGVLGEVRAFGLFFGVQVVKVAEEHVKTVFGGQVFIAVAQVVLAELGGVVALAFQGLGDGDVAVLQAHGGAGNAHLGQTGAARRLAGNEGGASGRATVFGVVVGEDRAFVGDPVDIRCAVSHDAPGVGADVRLPDVIAEDHQDVWFLARGLRLRTGRGTLGLRVGASHHCKSASG
ncbi:hypothetical protein D3C86_629430 [compost metagenome]